MRYIAILLVCLLATLAAPACSIGAEFWATHGSDYLLWIRTSPPAVTPYRLRTSTGSVYRYLSQPAGVTGRGLYAFAKTRAGNPNDIVRLLPRDTQHLSSAWIKAGWPTYILDASRLTVPSSTTLDGVSAQLWGVRTFGDQQQIIKYNPSTGAVQSTMMLPRTMLIPP